MTARKSSVAAAAGRIDRVIHEPARLALMAHLSAVEEADFVHLVRQTGLSEGNAGAHLKKLGEAGYVAIEKSFENNRPLTTYSLTGEGRRTLAEYLETMTELIGAIKP